MEIVHELTNEFDVFRLMQVPSGQNKKADVLSKLTALAFDHLRKNVWVEVLTKKYINEKSTVAPIDEEARIGGHLWCFKKCTIVLVLYILGTEQSLQKVMRIGYYWPTIYSDAAEIIRTCQSCQQHAPISRAPQHPMIPITAAWSFSKWAIDIVSHITACSGLVTPMKLSATVVLNLRASLLEAGVHHTTYKNRIGETRFNLVYGMKAVIPAGLMVPTKRIRSFDEPSNDEGLHANLDMLEERREIAAIREAANKQKISKYYDKRVKLMSFRIGDYVWRNNEASRAKNTGKLGPNWEGPYEVIGISAMGPISWQD
ncbi:uncharacterized protein [Rutidosis leptorrhynchoides]|uniref:uncharacterized protein n=1 Tax=Rutidosis leptorrhynchoides TaxID=125765 RepID=UPI003A9994F7